MSASFQLYRARRTPTPSIWINIQFENPKAIRLSALLEVRLRTDAKLATMRSRSSSRFSYFFKIPSRRHGRGFPSIPRPSSSISIEFSLVSKCSGWLMSIQRLWRQAWRRWDPRPADLSSAAEWSRQQASSVHRRPLGPSAGNYGDEPRLRPRSDTTEAPFGYNWANFMKSLHFAFRSPAALRQSLAPLQFSFRSFRRSRLSCSGCLNC